MDYQNKKKQKKEQKRKKVRRAKMRIRREAIDEENKVNTLLEKIQYENRERIKPVRKPRDK